MENKTATAIVAQLRDRAEKAGFDATGRPFLAIQVTLKDLTEDNLFYIEIKDDKLTFEAAEYADRQANIIMTSENFMKMTNGELNSMLALTTGKLKIEGDITKAKALKEIFKK
ncbi:MAG: SCP2 sterol-binding domain-containing protein [Oscillospiraceae bacterium]|nr:SCP2 sterol-binding domain-containing protein [Oscillospiraceae bacterium]